MIQKSGIIFLLLMLLLVGCDNPKSYSLEELEGNDYNELGLRVSEALDEDGFKVIFKELGAMDKAQVLDRLSNKDLELNMASFGIYYLANNYAKENNMEAAFKYHKIAADKYINPQSMLKLSEYYFHKEKNFVVAYIYLHQSLEVMVEITENNRSHPLAKNGRNKAQFLLDELEKASKAGKFNEGGTREKLKVELPDLLRKYREIYGLGEREGL